MKSGYTAAMVRFSLEAPAAIHFGAGALEKLRDLSLREGRKTLLLSGARWLASSEWKGKVNALLDGLDVFSLGCPEGEPSTETLASSLEAAEAFSPDFLIAIGGGSVLDTAKALSALVRHGGPVTKYLEGVTGYVGVPGPGLPWIAVPTTAGTGAEVTKNAVIRVTDLGVKRSMRSAYLLARAVIVDPQLTVSLPPRVTGIAGLDALTQLIEAYVTKKSNLLVRSLIEGAFPSMLRALQGLAREPGNVGLRSDASYGALVSGIALANAGLGAAHGFAAALGGMFAVPHGLACAVCLPHVLEANAEQVRKAIGRLTASPGTEGPAGDPVEWLVQKVREILSGFGLPLDLRDYRIPAERMREIAEKSSGSSMSGNPRELSLMDREKILAKII